MSDEKKIIAYKGFDKYLKCSRAAVNKRVKQSMRATLRALILLAALCVAAFTAGVVLGRAYSPVKAAYSPTPAEVKPVVLAKDPLPMLEEPEDPSRAYYGSCRITAYCACSQCCGEWANNRPLDENGEPIVYGSSGEALTSGVSAACALPFGTKLEIDGLPGTYVVEDRTAEWIQDKYDGMTVDIYMDSHQACYDLLAGMPEWMDVYILEEQQ